MEKVILSRSAKICTLSHMLQLLKFQEKSLLWEDFPRRQKQNKILLELNYIFPKDAIWGAQETGPRVISWVIKKNMPETHYSWAQQQLAKNCPDDQVGLHLLPRSKPRKIRRMLHNHRELVYWPDRIQMAHLLEPSHSMQQTHQGCWADWDELQCELSSLISPPSSRRLVSVLPPGASFCFSFSIAFPSILH